MIKHLLKLVWNRRRGNLLITLEIFACFLVLFATLAMIGHFVDNYKHPLGYDYENVWILGTTLSTLTDLVRDNDEEVKKYTLAFYQALKDMPEIEAVSVIGQAPYTTSWNSSQFEYRGKRVRSIQNRASDDLPQVLALEIVQGRWFSAEDDGLAWDPVVINRKLCQELFGDEFPLGKDISVRQDPPQEAASGHVELPASSHREKRVVGIISDFRKDGEFSRPDTYLFHRSVPGRDGGWEWLIRIRPGTTRAFQETLIHRLHSIHPDWSFEIDPVVDKRATMLQLQTAPMIAGGIVVSFLIVMVALGLVGIVWQDISRRTTEIGLRRALGAAASSIYHQILGELLVITSAGLLLGVLVVVQIPLLDLFGFLSASVYIYALVISLAVIYGVTLFCGLYPSRMATQVQPVEALRWE
jgi:putative ABC transport system permease protein